MKLCLLEVYTAKKSVNFENSAELSQFVQIEHQNASARDISDSHYTKIGPCIIDFSLERLRSACQ